MSRRLQDVTLSVRPGEVVCLLGDNGAGKSTLIQILSGVVRPDTGTVRVAGQDVGLRFADRRARQGHRDGFPRPRHRADHAGLSQFLPRARTDGRLGAISALRFSPRDRVAAENALRELGVDAAAVRRPIGALSGGQRQSVAVARAVHFGARILILDEPTSALGVKQAEIVLDYVRRAKAARNRRGLDHAQCPARLSDRRHVRRAVPRPPARRVQEVASSARRN